MKAPLICLRAYGKSMAKERTKAQGVFVDCAVVHDSIGYTLPSSEEMQKL